MKPGDVVQFGIVLKHLRKYRPEWQVSVVVGRGKHTALTGLCHRVYHDGEAISEGFDTEAMLGWYENYCQYEDRPNSKVTNCLREVFGLEYDRTLGRYEIEVPQDVKQRALGYYESIGAKKVSHTQCNVVLIHYEGNTSTWKKNLKHWQARALCDVVRQLGRVPVILDWDGRSPLPDQERIFCPRPGDNDLWGSFGSGDAAMIAALCSGAEAFLGVDSGPGKCASATSTPTLVAWIGHHPIQFHDPAPNTVHLVPHDWRRLPPAENRGVAAYFERNYRHRTYNFGAFGLIDEAATWLREVLANRVLPGESKRRIFACPNGIGDVLWALHKIKSIAGGEPIEIVLAGNPREEINNRAVPFLKRFSFIDKVSVVDVPIHQSSTDDGRTDEKGRYRYMQDGEKGPFYFLVPNTVLERGERLESWMPDYPIDWSVVQAFNWAGTERGQKIGRSLGDFAAFYLGPEAGNVDEGHNRGFLWEPRDWITVGKALTARGMKIAVVGASYDRSFWERYVREGAQEAGMEWIDLIGRLEIGETMAVLRQAQLFLSYQCGLAIFAHYLGVRVGCWWRPDGDSIHPRRLVSFDERMATAWTNPKYADRYIPLIYKRQSAEEVVAEMERRGWLDISVTTG